MKSALIHGVLLVAMLVYGYRTWTRDKTQKEDRGQVVLWDKDEAELVAIEYKSDKKTVRLERRTDSKEPYWWGTETTIEKKPKPKAPTPDPKPDPGAGSASGSGSGAKPPAGSGAGDLDPHKGDISPKQAGSGSAGSAGSAVAQGSGSAAKPPATGSAGSGSAGSGSAGSAVAQGSGSGSGSAAPKLPPKPPEPVEMVETTRKREFPLGDNGDKLVKTYTEARALRDLGQPSVDQLIDYKLADTKQLEAKITELKALIEERKTQQGSGSGSGAPPKDEQLAQLQKKLKEAEDQKKATDGKARTTLTVSFRDGSRTFLVGGSVYGGSDRYVIDPQSNTAYVLSKEMISGLEIGESNLQLTDPRGFEVAKVESVEIEWGTRKKAAVRIDATDATDKKQKTWGDADTKKANQPLATFIDNIGNLRPTEYSTTVKTEGLQPMVKLTYKDAGNKVLGTVVLYKIEKEGVLPEGQELDPANPPKGEIQYYVWTERTHVPALVRKDTAQRAEQDLPIVFGDKAAPEKAPPPNPLQPNPLQPPGGGGHGGHGH